MDFGHAGVAAVSPPRSEARAAAHTRSEHALPLQVPASGQRAAAQAARPQHPVLVIAADPALQAGLADGLEQVGFVAAIVDDIGSALMSPDEVRPAGIVVELNLGSRPALEAFAALRMRAAARLIPVIVLCAQTDAESVRTATRNGIRELLPRAVPIPIVLHRLAHVVREYDVVRGWRAREARRRLLAEKLPDTLLRIDAQGTIKEVLAVGTSGIGLALDARGRGRRLDDMLPAPAGTSFATLCAAAIEGRHPVERELVRADGDGITTIDFRLVPFGPGRGLVILRDLTERLLAASYDPRGTHFYDSLTGLPNRALFMSRLREVLADGPPPDSSVAIIRLQVDQFKKVDQSLGPATADELLGEMGRRLIGLVEGGSPADSPGAGSLVMAARLEPDAFALLAVSLADRSACAAIAERIRQPLSEPVLLAGRELRSTVSIGISLWPENGADGETLMRNAAMAANHARADGTARLYTDTLRMRSLRGLDIEQHLRRALEGDELCLHYQPKIDVGRGALVGFEALLRWEPVELGRLDPAEIVAVAEQSGLIGALGEWVLRRACADAPSFQDPTVGPISVAVNVSAGQFAGGDLAAMTRAIIERAAIKPALLELELTESVLMNDSGRAFRTFSELRTLGIKLAIDDFGTGYSSLQYLRRLPIDALKIDGSFVKDIAHDTGAYAICSAVIALGHSLGLEVIAEGVETVAQAQALKARSCDGMQGYLIGRPMPGPSVITWIRRGEWRRAIERTQQPVATDY